jgi:transposase
MGYSSDLRVRVIGLVESGGAARAAARQFAIGDSTAIRWTKRWRETGSYEAKSNKGQSRSPLKKHEEWLLELVRWESDLTLEEIQCRLLDERQQKAGLGSVWRVFDRHGISFKKSVRAAEQDRPDVAAARAAWVNDQAKLDPERLVFIDETGTSTNMARLRGRAPRRQNSPGSLEDDDLRRRLALYPEDRDCTFDVSVTCGWREYAERLRRADQIRSAWCRTRCTPPRVPFRARRRAHARTAR